MTVRIASKTFSCLCLTSTVTWLPLAIVERKPVPDPDDGRAEHGTRKENAASDWIAGSGLPQPFSATFADSARAVAACLTVPLATLPSRHESFFIVGDFPDSVFSNAKAKRLLGWEPTDLLTPYFTRASL
jgi:hypothetical protein